MLFCLSCICQVPPISKTKIKTSLLYPNREIETVTTRFGAPRSWHHCPQLVLRPLLLLLPADEAGLAGAAADAALGAAAAAGLASP